MRLNRFLAAAGLGSRRSCDALIASGAVVINGHKIDQLATQVEDGDDVRVKGRPVRAALPVHILLNKPKGFVVTRSDEHGRRTVYDLLPPEFSTLCHVGRLDKESEGLLLLTNDGALAQKLTHPSHEIEKEYEVNLDKDFKPEDIPTLLKGIYIEGGCGRFERVHIVSTKRLQVILRQGIKRQIRLMFYSLGYEVERLVRTRIGKLRDDRMPLGACRRLTKLEIGSLTGTSKKSAKPASRKPASKQPRRVVKKAVRPPKA